MPRLGKKETLGLNLQKNDFIKQGGFKKLFWFRKAIPERIHESGILSNLLDK